MVKLYKELPSNLLGIEDAYTSYCFNEACYYIISRIEKGDEPVFKVKYNSFSDLYKQYK